MGNQLFKGQSVAFFTGGVDEVVDDVTIKNPVGLHISVGQTTKNVGKLGASISGQFAALRIKLLAANISLESNDTFLLTPWRKVLKGALPLVVHAHSADVIAAAIRIKKEFAGISMIIVGGAEAWVVADRLAEAHVPVILAPARCISWDTFEQRRCKENGLRELGQRNVKVGIATADPDNARNLRWEAGMTKEIGFAQEEALALITKNVADIFGLGKGIGTIEVDTKANFAVFDGNPLEFMSKPMLVAVGSRIDCYPLQY